MAKINIEHNTQLGPDETFTKIRGLIEDNRDLKSIDKNYSFGFDESQRSAHAKGKGFEADLKVDGSDSASTIQFNIKVGLMLTPFKSTIEEKLRRKLEKVFA